MILTALWKRLVLAVDLARPNSRWREDVTPASLAAWDAWDRALRRRLGLRSALAFWGRTNVPGCRNLVACHWPHRLCWSWLLSATWVRKDRLAYAGPNGLRLIVSRRYRHADLHLWRLRLHAAWQDDQWMAAGHHRETVPRLIWARHLAGLEAAGGIH